MRVIAGIEPASIFENPAAIFRAWSAADADAALASAEAALREGYWLAGYLGYALGEALVGMVPRPHDWPLLALGAFAPPHVQSLPSDDDPARCAPPLATVPDATYDRTVARLQRAIADGYVYQVNYTTPFAFAVVGDPLAAYVRVARRTAARYQVYFEDANRIVLSWSPELFLAFDGRRITAKPMKGTAPTDRPERLTDAKNRAEHVMIVDLLRNDLHRVCDRVDIEALFAQERYPRYVTCTSTIGGTLREGASLEDVVRAAFPCGSVTGAPKRAAMRYIAAGEPLGRGVYCGSLGFLSPERRGWWNVAIRTAQIDARTGSGRFDAGGAIVADSTAPDERAEIALKAAFLRDDGFAILEAFAADADDPTVDAHRARLARSAVAFGIVYDASELERMAKVSRQQRGLVRLRLNGDGTLATTIEDDELAPGDVTLALSDAYVRSDDPYLRHKTTWRPAHDRARREAERLGCFDALLRNERDEVTEGWRSNLFALLDGRLVTPPLRCGLLPGILRARLVTEGAIERPIAAGDLRRAKAIYVGNSARGLRRARLLS